MSIDLNRLTEMSRSALLEAQAEARRRQQQQVDIPHLFFALLKQEHGAVPALLEKMNLQPSALEHALGRELGRLPTVTGAVDPSRVLITQALQDVFTKAEEAAARLKDDYISVEHLFLGLILATKPAEWVHFIRSFGLTESKALQALQVVRGSQRVTSQNPEATYQALAKYGIDLV